MQVGQRLLHVSIPIEVCWSVMGIYVLARGHVVYAVRARELMYASVGIESKCLVVSCDHYLNPSGVAVTAQVVPLVICYLWAGTEGCA